MAVAATSTILAAMLVIRSVTFDTCRPEFVLELASMTGGALGLSMLARQLKVRGLVVIEMHAVPGLGPMAALALLPETPGVGVI
jgi:hypothetical protein